MSATYYLPLTDAEYINGLIHDTGLVTMTGQSVYCHPTFCGVTVDKFIIFVKEFIPYLMKNHTKVAVITIPNNSTLTRLGEPDTFVYTAARASPIINVIKIISLWCMDNSIIWDKLISNGVYINDDDQTEKNLMYLFTHIDAANVPSNKQYAMCQNFHSLVRFNPNVWCTLFVTKPNLYKRLGYKTKEMKSCMEYHEMFPSLHSSSNVIITPEFVSNALRHRAWVIEDFKVQLPEHCWYIIRCDPWNIRYVREPTIEMVEYVSNIVPSLINKVKSDILTHDLIIRTLPHLDKYSLTHMRCLRTPTLLSARDRALLTITDIEKKIMMYRSDMLELIFQIPLMHELFGIDNHLFGRFVRWLIYTTIKNNRVPDIPALYKFLENSDIDIYVQKSNFNLIEFYERLVRFGGHMEFSGYDAYNSAVAKSYDGKKHSTGHYHVWYPSIELESGWIKYDLMINFVMNHSPITSVNGSTIGLDKPVLRGCNDIVTRRIRPINIGTGNPSKLIIRMQKLIDTYGYTIAVDQRHTIQYLFRLVDSNEFKDMYLPCDSISSPSYETSTIGEIPITKHKLIPLTKELFDASEFANALRVWAADNNGTTAFGN